MTDDRLIIAIGRLERALTRAETAADRAVRDATLDQDLAALTSRHEKLRSRTQEAIDALDRLIG